MINGKAKGSNYERTVAKQFSQWSGLEFHRTPASGALHWENDTRVTGDIVPPPSIKFPFSIECKCREVPFDFDALLTGTSSIWEFWKQCLRDASRADLEPMLIFSKNRRHTYVMIEKHTADTLFKGKQNIRSLDIYFYEPMPVTICELSSLLEICTLDDILKISELKEFLK